MSRGIRFRITSLSTVAVLFVLLAAALALVTVQREVLTDSVDEVLDRHAAAVSQLVESGTIPRVIDGQGDDESFAVVSDRAGARISSTADPPLGIPPATASGGVERFTVDEAGDSGAFRMRSSAAGPYTVIVGTPLDDVDESVATLTHGLATAVPLVSAVLAVLVWFTVGRVLAPVERIRRRVETIGDVNLDQRVPDPGTGDEISRLAQTMNEMLGRLEVDAARQRGFIGDASHELRSPVARLRARLEVDAAHPGGANLIETHRIVLDELTGLQTLVDDLLLLAQTDSTPVGDGQIVDLDDVVMHVLTGMQPAARERVDITRLSAARVVGHSGRLARVVRNLIDNAISHTEGRVFVTLSEHDDLATLIIEDEGPEIPINERDRMFERFTRLDDARSRGTGGAGLGLAIARQITRAHGGDIRVERRDQYGNRFSLELPTPIDASRASESGLS